MNTKRLLMFFIVMIVLVDLAYFYPRLTGLSGKEFKYQKEPAFCLRVIDGDTIEIKINKTIESVRLLGINTPEKGKPFYDEAKIFLSEMENKSIEILRDSEDRDKYGRMLRYAFYENRFLNKELLENGLANTYFYEELWYQKQLIEAQEKARQEQRGLWKKSNGKCSNCIELLELNPREEYFILKNNCDFSCELEAKDEANHFFNIEINGKEEKKIESKGNIWNNNRDSLFLRDKEGLVLYYSY